ncbi:MAG: M2 family metallopeptidase [Actinomycetota bacterium]|nr:M2 family metallopeptidase [Actinomycetota bacterium]
MQRAPHRFVDEFESRLEPLESEFHRAYWDSQVHASPENERRRADLELELRGLKGDESLLAAVTEALDEGVHEPVLARQLEVMRLSLTGNQMTDAQRLELVRLSSEVESEFNRHRPRVDGEELDENAISQILRTSDDVELRRRTYLAAKEIGPKIGNRVRELARLRNAAALKLGFADYFTMSLELQELSEEWLLDLFDELDAATSATYTAWKDDLDEGLRERFKTDVLFPWHYSDPFFQHLPSSDVTFDPQLKELSAAELATKTFDRWDIDLRPVIERSDLSPRPLKSEEAFCLDVDRSGADVRILANVVPGERWIHIMLHECGHAAYDISFDRRLPYLLRRPAHIFVTEGIAILAERRGRDPAWLNQIAGVSEEEITDRAHALKIASARQSILFARWVMVVSHFERALYADPETDLDELWWGLVERFQLIRRPEMDLPDAWASKVHIAVAPVYYQNYLLGELVASQLEETLIDRTGSLLNSDAGGVLRRDLFKHGNSWRWDKLIEEATGHPLTPKYFSDQVNV